MKSSMISINKLNQFGNVSQTKFTLIFLILYLVSISSISLDKKENFVREKLIENINKNNKIYLNIQKDDKKHSQISNDFDKKREINLIEKNEKVRNTLDVAKIKEKNKDKNDINVNKYLKQKFDIDLGSVPFMDIGNLFDNNSNLYNNKKSNLEFNNPFENKNFIKLIKRVNQLKNKGTSYLNKNSSDQININKHNKENPNSLDDNEENESWDDKISKYTTNKKIKNHENFKNKAKIINNINKNNHINFETTDFDSGKMKNDNKNVGVEKQHFNHQIQEQNKVNHSTVLNDKINRESQNFDDSYPFDNEEDTANGSESNKDKNLIISNKNLKLNNSNKILNNFGKSLDNNLNNNNIKLNYQNHFNNDQLFKNKHKYITHDNLNNILGNDLENHANINIIKLNPEQLENLHKQITNDNKINLIITPQNQKPDDFKIRTKKNNQFMYNHETNEPALKNPFLNNQKNNEQNEDHWDTNSANKQPNEKFLTIVKSKKSDFLDEVDEDTEKIFNNMCAMSDSLEVSIDKINLELDTLKNFNEIQRSNLNKQKLLIKFAKIINRLNYITVELTLIEDLVKTLKLSNCESLPKINKKFEHANETAPQIIQNIQNYLKNKNFVLSIFILSQ